MEGTLTMVVSKTVDVPGARIRYLQRGSGPLLLLIAGGDGDATASEPSTITTHAEDVRHLLAALTTEPAFVYGSSIGALISLELVSQHPELVSTLVAHEPPVTQLLPEPERTRAWQDQQEAEDIHQAEGAFPALLKFAAFAGIDPADREPDATVTPLGPERLPNLEFFLTHDAPAVRRHQLNMAALKDAPTRIVPAVGQASAHVEFPGGRNGAVFQPRAFAARLQEVLSGTLR
jgi:pimeloyl-ACP methyl ester carboxylesterase